MNHKPLEPTEENGWSWWWCERDETPCASDNPCDCCDEMNWALS